MDGAEHAKEEKLDGSAGTLGELLYADRTQTPVSEKEWVGLVQSIAAAISVRSTRSTNGRIESYSHWPCESPAIAKPPKN